MRALITGGYGFVGRHLAAHLVKCGDDVGLTYLPGVEVPQDNDKLGKGIHLPKSSQSLALDIENRQQVEQLVELTKPDIIYHLAAVSHVPDCDKDPEKIYRTNFFGTLNFLDAIAKHSKNTRMLIVSSSEVYGDPLPASVAVTENSVLRPINTYGLSKAAADLAGYRYAFSEGLHTIRVRSFPHTGPGQADKFVLSSFARQVAEIKLGLREPKIMVGNLDVKRDFSDVSDIVRGYREAILNGKRGDVYNLCSGKSATIASLLEKLVAISGVDAEVVVDQSRYRLADVPEIFGSYDKAQKDFGWKPRIDLEGTLHSLFAYWMEMLA